MSHKLLVVTTVPITIRSFLLPFIEHFKSLGWQVDGMAQEIYSDQECVTACDRIWDIQWSRNVLDPRNLLAGVSRVKEVVKEGQYELVHVHTPIAAFVTRYALRKFPQTRVIYTAHGFHFYRGGNKLKNAIFFNLEKLAGAWTDFLVTINQEDANAAQENNFLDSRRIYYTRGIGVDTNLYAANQVTDEEVQEIRQELNLADDDVLLLCIAEFTSRKRHQDLLNALVKLANPKVHLALAGAGPRQNSMQALVEQLGLGQQVHFLGDRTDIPALIKVARCVLLVSQQEGLPRSVMEAMCIQTPVIGTDIRGTRDLLENGCGLIVPLGDVEAIATAMKQIISDPAKAKEIATKAKAKIANYDLVNIIKAHEEIYAAAIAELKS